ncbi:hypothetical protein QR680_011670 [Steinernema hermaphroditum]|uniref:BTB domain-containing protein n=1 Tax=Steinernema hermaphroditum TaxID=289476 RepID=A0AA39LZE0_9BILA|nr:hypothetical protein QR680_011670 [Steinernema hermaphroditum]
MEFQKINKSRSGSRRWVSAANCDFSCKWTPVPYPIFAMSSSKLEFSFSFKPKEVHFDAGQHIGHDRSPIKQYCEMDWYVGVKCNVKEDVLGLYFINKQVEDGHPIVFWGDYEFCFTVGEGVKENKFNGNFVNSVSYAVFNCRMPNMNYRCNDAGSIKVILEVTFKSFTCYRLDIPQPDDPDIVHLRLDCGKNLYVSKTRLCQFSHFFDNMFKQSQIDDGEAKVCQIHKVKFLSALLILHTMYGLEIYPKLCASTDQIHETLRVCDQWLCESAIRAIEMGIIKTLVPGVCDLLLVADRFRMYHLVDAVAATMNREQLRNLDLTPYSIESLRLISRTMQYHL